MFNAIKKTPFIVPLIKLKKLFYDFTSQSNEAEIIAELVEKHQISKTFIEFGFSGWEFNTIGLANSWEGFLVDVDQYNVTIAQTIFGKNIHSAQHWLTKENLHIFKDWLANRKLGILSIDVDGNDFWFLEKLISLNPEIISIEYNPSFKLYPVTSVYDKNFDRTKKHPDWTYYGMSLEAAHRFLSFHNYSLVKISLNCVNAFFVRNELIENKSDIIFPDIKHCDYDWPEGISTDSNWQSLENYEFIEVNKDLSLQPLNNS
jgi:hypothetical protein